MLISSAKHLNIFDPMIFMQPEDIINNRKLALTLSNCSIVRVDTNQTYTHLVPVKVNQVMPTQLDPATTVYTLTAGTYILTPRFKLSIPTDSDITLVAEVTERFAFVGVTAVVTSSFVVINVAATGKLYLQDTETLCTVQLYDNPSLQARFYRWIRTII